MDNPTFYPDIEDEDFYKKILKKKEFNMFADNIYTNHFGLQSHQRLVANYINPTTPYNNVLLFFQTGTGKTMTSLLIASNFLNLNKKMNVCIITKNTFIRNVFHREINRLHPHIIDKDKHANRFVYHTYGTLNNLINKKQIRNLSNKVIIIDEAHNILHRDFFDVFNNVLKNSKNYKLILLTATPFFDTIEDINPLIKLLNPDKPDAVVELSKRRINDIAFKTPLYYVNKKNMDTVIDLLKGKVFHISENINDFPLTIFKGINILDNEPSIKYISCPMSKFQTKIAYEVFKTEITNAHNMFKPAVYTSFIIFPDGSYGKEGIYNNFTVKKNIIIPNNPSMLKFENINMYSSKLYKMLEIIKQNKGKKIFIYSNYISYSGLKVAQSVLEANGITSYGVIRENMDISVRMKIINKYNRGDIDYILGSSIMSEGITLKNTEILIVLDHHWNFSRLSQVIGRASRYKSHDGLPVDRRKVEVFLLCAENPKDKTLSLDYNMLKVCQYKDLAIADIEYNMKKTSVNCSLNKKKLPREYEFSKRCEYKACDYICAHKNDETIDTSTFDLKLHNPELFNYILNKIVLLFNKDIFVVVSSQMIDEKFTLDDLYYVLNDMVKSTYIFTIKDITYEIIKLANDIFMLKDITKSLKHNIYANIINTNIKDKKIYFKLFNTPTIAKEIKKVITYTHLEKNKIYKTYKNKFGEDDGVFRLIDTRDNNVSVYGRVCHTLPKEDLEDIHFFLTKINQTGKFKKKKICSILETILEWI